MSRERGSFFLVCSLGTAFVSFLFFGVWKGRKTCPKKTRALYAAQNLVFDSRGSISGSPRAPKADPFLYVPLKKLGFGRLWASLLCPPRYLQASGCTFGLIFCFRQASRSTFYVVSWCFGAAFCGCACRSVHACSVLRVYAFCV